MFFGKQIFVLFFICLSLQPSYAEEGVESSAGFLSRYIGRIKGKLTPKAVEFDESRRAFMRKGAGAAAGAGIMASSGGGAVAAILEKALRSEIPENVLKRLARLRVNHNSVIPLDSASLSAYRRALVKELSRTSSHSVKLAIQERLNQMEQAFSNRDLLESIADRRADLSTPDRIFMEERQRKRAERRLQKARDRLIADGKLQSLELLVLTARSLLDDVLLRKIAYQIRFVDPSKGEFAVVFTEEDFKAIRHYSSMINSLEKSQRKSFSKNSFLSQWLPLLRHEADLAIEMYEVSKYATSSLGRAGSCKSLL